MPDWAGICNDIPQQQYSGILYTQTKTSNPIAIPGITELMTREDPSKIISYIYVILWRVVRN
jgi:hypothetical protein